MNAGSTHRLVSLLIVSVSLPRGRRASSAAASVFSRHWYAQSRTSRSARGSPIASGGRIVVSGLPSASASASSASRLVSALTAASESTRSSSATSGCAAAAGPATRRRHDCPLRTSPAEELRSAFQSIGRGCWGRITE